jgi:glycosyltransferase involved in cell wall biosynthesis
LRQRKNLFSVVVPVFNEEANLVEFHRRLSKAIEKEKGEWEFIFVDDGSDDQSFETIHKLSKLDRRVKALKFSRNFGSHVAIAAGLDYCHSDAAIIMSADLQDPPEVIPAFLRKWREGYQVIWGARESRRDTWTRRVLAGIFYGLIRKIALPNYPRGGTGSFCMMDRMVVNSFRQCQERNRVTFGLVSWAGFKQTEVPYQRATRLAGKSKWTIGKMVKNAIDSIVSFSYVPIRLISYLGMVISLAGFLAIIYLIVARLFWGQGIVGWTSLMVMVLFLGGVQLIVLGVIGEYLWRIHEEVKQRPLYIVSKEIGLRAKSKRPDNAG